MKNIYILFIALSALFLTGCENDTITYSGPDFVSFSEATISKAIRAGEDGVVSIEIGCAGKSNEARTFTVAVDAANTTAVEGTDFDFVSKTVTIPAGEYVGKLQIKGNYDNLTPEGVTLTLKLNADEAMIQEGTTTVCKLNLSRFFEFNMDWLEGDWLAADTQNGEPDGDPYGMEIEQINGDTIAIKGIWGTSAVLKGIVDWDNSQIQIPMGQYMYTHNSGGPMYFFNVQGSSLVNGPVICEVSYKGIVTGTYGVLNASYSGWFPFVTTMEKMEE